MESGDASSSPSDGAQLAQGQLPTFVTQTNTSSMNKSVSTQNSTNQQQDGIHHATSSSASIMVIQQPGIPSAVGLVPSSVSVAQVAVTAGNVQASGEHPQIGGLYTATAGLPAEYVIPGANMLQTGAQGFQVHVPVMPQQEQGSEDAAQYHEMEDDSRGDRLDELREQDRFLPIANVARIMKKGIPKHGKIAKDAKECVQECVSEFISFITSEASERCQQEKRKTINGEDILFAMSTLGFDNYVDPLKLYLTKYRDAIKGEKGALNSSTETTPSSEVEQNIEETSENKQISQQLQFQVAGTALHPSMVTGDVPSSTIYTYPAQLQTTAIHFQ